MNKIKKYEKLKIKTEKVKQKINKKVFGLSLMRDFVPFW